jgi:pilus assembly protein Flp/PilA
MIQLISAIYSSLAAAHDDDRGAGMVEYGLLVAFIALVALIGVTALGIRIDDLFDRVTF